MQQQHKYQYQQQPVVAVRLTTCNKDLKSRVLVYYFFLGRFNFINELVILKSNFKKSDQTSDINNTYQGITPKFSVIVTTEHGKLTLNYLKKPPKLTQLSLRSPAVSVILMMIFLARTFGFSKTTHHRTTLLRFTNNEIFHNRRTGCREALKGPSRSSDVHLFSWDYLKPMVCFKTDQII